MSSKDKPEIQPLQKFGKDWKKGTDKDVKPRKVRFERRYPLISLPKDVLKKIAKVLAADVKDLEVTYQVNPFASEIKLKFHKKPKKPLPHELEKSGSKSKGEKKPT